MISKTLTLTLLCAVALGTPAPVAAQDARGARETMAGAMANAMVRMMEAMGLFGGGSYGSWGGVPAMSGLMRPYGSMMGMPGGSPWGMPMQDPSQALGMGTDAMKQMYPGIPGAGAGTGTERLDGVWEGSGGDLLIVQGGRYRIYAPQDQYIDGLLQQQSSRVALYNVQDGHTQVFEFATQDGRLALRNAGGQVYLFRRFGGSPLASGLAPAAPSVDTSPPPATAPEPSAPKTSGAR
jgi:hypothetical protein